MMLTYSRIPSALLRKNHAHSQPGHTRVHRPHNQRITLKELFLQSVGLDNLICRKGRESLCREWWRKGQNSEGLLLGHKSCVHWEMLGVLEGESVW